MPHASSSTTPSPHLTPVALLSALQGCVLGTAVGDSVGLPFENLSRHSVAKLLRPPLEQSLIWGRGLVSDDTEHTLMVAASLLDAGPDVAVFRRRLAARLRWWLVSGPPGVGSATARSILKLWVGISSARSGVRSAGNGPAMRAAVIGVVWGGDPARLADFVRASTEITHTDPQAIEAALAVAVAAHCAAHLGATTPSRAFEAWERAYRQASPAPATLAAATDLLRQAVDGGWALDALAARLGCEHGVTGYAMHTVPAALYAWMLHSGDLRQAVTEIVQCGGDTDSTAAIVGGIVGAGVGPGGVPVSWRERLWAWPQNVAWMLRLTAGLAEADGAARPPGFVARCAEWAWWPVHLLRNLAMFGVVLYVFFRRLTLVAFKRAAR